MYAVEFQTSIKDGTIEIPSEYRNRFKGSIRVIILAEEQTEATNMIEYLMKNPIHAPGFTPLKRDELYER
ncbi:MAG: hypothetical protein HC828_09635 [Blastochloris sp.]|nr:hypothetical protein [Blastochloris sp.]